MEKGTRVEQIARGDAAAARRRGIEVGFFLQFGYPGETRDDIEQTLRDGARLPPGRHRHVGVVSAAGHARSTSACRRSSAQKQNWVDSERPGDDVSRDVRARSSTARCTRSCMPSSARARRRRARARSSAPAATRPAACARGCTAVYQAAQAALLQRRLDRLARLTRGRAADRR